MDVRLLYVGYHEQSTQEYVETPRSKRHVNVAFEDLVRQLRTEPLPEFDSNWSRQLANNPPLPGDVDTRWSESESGGESPNPVWPGYDV